MRKTAGAVLACLTQTQRIHCLLLWFEEFYHPALVGDGREARVPYVWRFSRPGFPLPRSRTPPRLGAPAPSPTRMSNHQAAGTRSLAAMLKLRGQLLQVRKQLLEGR